MSGTIMTPAEIEAVVASLKAGKSYRAIAAEIGRSKTTIERVVERLSMPARRPRTGGDPLSAARQEQARQLVEDGYSFQAAAKVIGCDPKTVSKIARRHGLLPTRKFGGAQDMSRSLRARIEAMAGSTVTNARAAELLGCTAAEVAEVRDARRRAAKARARKAYQDRDAMPAPEEDRLGVVLKTHPRPVSVAGDLLGVPVTIGRVALEQTRRAA